MPVVCEKLRGHLPSRSGPSHWRPARGDAAEFRARIDVQTVDHSSDIGIVGIVQHEITGGADFWQSAGNAGGARAAIHENQIEGLVWVNVDGVDVFLKAHAGIIFLAFIKNETGSCIVFRRRFLADEAGFLKLVGTVGYATLFEHFRHQGMPGLFMLDGKELADALGHEDG